MSIQALHTAATGLHLQELHVNIKSQNMSAQGVHGYKKQYLAAADLPYQDLGKVGADSSGADTRIPSGLQIGMGVKPAGIYRSFKAGDMIQTDNPLDIAISGDGFFPVQMPDGTQAYTRAGIFGKNQEGLIVTPDGYTLGQGITIPPEASDVFINETGQVFVSVPGQVERQQIGEILLSTFANPAGLKSVGKNLFTETESSGNAIEGQPMTDNRGALKQNFLEGSNVDAVEEIIDLIKIQRWYEMLTKVINTGDAMLEASVRMGK